MALSHPTKAGAPMPFQIASEYKHLENTHFLCDTIESVNKAISRVKEIGICSFCFETTGIEWWKEEDNPTLISISARIGWSFVIPLYHEHTPFSKEDIDAIMMKLWINIFGNPLVNKIAHNAKLDFHFIYKYCPQKTKGRINDIMLMHALLDENTSHELKSLVDMYLPYFRGYDSVVSKNVGVTLPIENSATALAITSDVILRLYCHFENKLKEDDFHGTLYTLYRNLTIPSLKLFLKAEHTGCKVNVSYILESIEVGKRVIAKLETDLRLDKHVKRFELIVENELREKAIKAVEGKLIVSLLKVKDISPLTLSNARAFVNFQSDPKIVANYKAQLKELRLGTVKLYDGLNFNSPVQMKEFLYTSKGLNLTQQVDIEGKSLDTTSKGVLARYKNDFIDKYVLAKTAKKLVATYYEGILKKVDSNGFIHPTFNLHGTVTGRISAENPNVQNIPSRNSIVDADVADLFNRVKRFFIPLSEEHEILTSDYSQAELKMIANFSQDKEMIRVYQNGIDIHSVTAAAILGISIDKLKELDEKKRKETRSAAKNANFGMVYGIGYKTYSEQLQKQTGIIIDKKTFDIYSNALFGTYKMLKVWHTKYQNLAKRNGFVRTLFGRKRRLLNINSSDSKLSSAAERAAINAPIQGTVGEWTLFATVIMDMVIGDDAQFFNNVHDAVDWYTLKGTARDFIPIMQEIASMPPLKEFFGISEQKIAVKMSLDFSFSAVSWADTKEV